MELETYLISMEPKKYLFAPEREYFMRQIERTNDWYFEILHDTNLSRKSKFEKVTNEFLDELYGVVTTLESKEAEKRSAKVLGIFGNRHIEAMIADQRCFAAVNIIVAREALHCLRKSRIIPAIAPIGWCAYQDVLWRSEFKQMITATERITTKEAAKRIVCDESYVRRLARKSQIDAKKNATGTWMCTSASISQYMRDRQCSRGKEGTGQAVTWPVP